MGNYEIGKRWPDHDSIIFLGFDPKFNGESGPNRFDYTPFEEGGVIDSSRAWNALGSLGWKLPEYIARPYWGLFNTTGAPAGPFISRPLWVRFSYYDDDVKTLADPPYTGWETNCVFYHAYYKQRWGPLVNLLQWGQYANEYRAMRREDYVHWQMGTRAVSGPFLTEEDREKAQDRADSGSTSFHPTYTPVPLETPSMANSVSAASANASQKVFEEGESSHSRLQSKFTAERWAMEKIKSGVVKTLPLSAITSGSANSGRMGYAINQALKKAGYTPAQIEWFHNGGLTDPLKDGLGLFKNTGNPNRIGAVVTPPKPPAPKITPPTPAVTQIVVRAPVGYTKPAGRGADMRPHIQQVSSFLDEPERYFFRNIPNTVSYQGLGSRWVEIPRKGDFPIVEWSDWALMKVSFDFLVAHEMDGLYADVSEDIDQLRRMAQRPYPVSIFGLDQLFSLQMKRAQSTGRAMQFVIANFTVKSARRTVGEGDKEIAAAQCSMTLQEIPIENMKIVEMTMPPLVGPNVPGPTTDGNESSSPGLLSDLVAQNGEIKDGWMANLMSGPQANDFSMSDNI